MPKEKLFEVMAEIRKLSLNAPVHTGDLIVENILGSWKRSDRDEKCRETVV
ncbi:MAG: DUF1667 domain-containing protein [Pilosibacter sp.]